MWLQSSSAKKYLKKYGTFVVAVVLSLALSFFKPNSNFGVHLAALVLGYVTAFVQVSKKAPGKESRAFVRLF
jgi:hypothetical protein